jgi:cardiolipin synthase
MKKINQILFHRSVLVGLSMLVQLGVLASMILSFSEHFETFFWVCIALSVLTALWIISRPMEPAYKIAWLIPILTMPVFGGIFYLLSGGGGVSKRTQRRMADIDRRSRETLAGDFRSDQLAKQGEDAAGQARYLEQYACCPVYTNTRTEYFPLGELAYARMLKELDKAEKYIFLEYFIIQEGTLWDSILEILVKKAAQGVEVRLLYDDFGCMYTIPKDYDRQMEAMGIQCRVFSRLVPVLSIRQNNRDHRKLMIIDGRVGFTGGMNLADEYINQREKYGHWKDSAILLQGEAVWSMSVMFLSMWDHCSGWKEDFDRFRPEPASTMPAAGWVQPYTDTPLDHEKVSQTVYLNMISRARKSIYITTPYLIVDEATNTALCNAAKSGVDVRIITPHIPDKRYVFEVTRAHYPPLLEAGVRIYEYTPGFIHAKNFVVDGKYATVGTVNLDYRSLFLHFENGVWLYDVPCIRDIQKDFLSTLERCEKITIRRFRHLNILVQLYRSILRIFAPLM